MFTCIFCPKTKGLMNEITNQFKGLSLKTARANRRKRKQQQQEEVAVDEEEAMDRNEQEEEWIAEPEPGVFITLVALAKGTNRLKKIRFREEMYDVLGAQRWLNENYQKVMELYNIHQEDQSQSEDEYPTASVEAQQSGKSSTTTSDNSSGSAHRKEDDDGVGDRSSLHGIQNEIDTEVAEQVAEDEPGVFVTIRSLPDGSREILRVELSRERFGEVKARVWWEENKARLRKQYS